MTKKTTNKKKSVASKKKHLLKKPLRKKKPLQNRLLKKKTPAQKKSTPKKKPTYNSEQIYNMTEQAAYFAALNDQFKKIPAILEHCTRRNTKFTLNQYMLDRFNRVIKRFSTQ